MFHQQDGAEPLIPLEVLAAVVPPEVLAAPAPLEVCQHCAVKGARYAGAAQDPRGAGAAQGLPARRRTMCSRCWYLLKCLRRQRCWRCSWRRRCLKFTRPALLELLALLVPHKVLAAPALLKVCRSGIILGAHCVRSAASNCQY